MQTGIWNTTQVMSVRRLCCRMQCSARGTARWIQPPVWLDTMRLTVLVQRQIPRAIRTWLSAVVMPLAMPTQRLGINPFRLMQIPVATVYLRQPITPHRILAQAILPLPSGTSSPVIHQAMRDYLVTTAAAAPGLPFEPRPADHLSLNLKVRPDPPPVP